MIAVIICLLCGGLFMIGFGIFLFNRGERPQGFLSIIFGSVILAFLFPATADLKKQIILEYIAEQQIEQVRQGTMEYSVDKKTGVVSIVPVEESTEE